MRCPFSSLATVVLTASLLAGCGGGALVDRPGPRASHNGTFLELPNGVGHVEVVVEPAAGEKAAGPKARGQVVAYFTGPDGTAPLSPAPSDVTLAVEGGKTYPLAPKAEGRFESTPAPVPVGDVAGKLSAKLGADPIALEVRPR